MVVSVGHLWPWYVEQMRARFPSSVWPPFEGEGALPPGYLRELLEALEPRQPVYAALSLDTSGLIAPDAAGRSYGTLPRGVAWRILPRGASVSAVEWAAWNRAFLTAALERLGDVPDELDMDSKSTLLQYALALSQNAALLERLGQNDAARETWRQVLSLDPDRHERDVAEDAWRGLGVRVPRMEAGERAREALARLPGG
jgi:tetratricopeptide (TPR) repeat protein